MLELGYQKSLSNTSGEGVGGSIVILAAACTEKGAQALSVFWTLGKGKRRGRVR